MQIDKSKIAKYILDRIKVHYDLKTDVELANMLNVSQSTLSVWRSRGSINFWKIIDICKDLNFHWMITGEGSETRSGVTTYAEGESGRDVVADSETNPYSSRSELMAQELENCKAVNGLLQERIRDKDALIEMLKGG